MKPLHSDFVMHLWMLSIYFIASGMSITCSLCTQLWVLYPWIFSEHFIATGMTSTCERCTEFESRYFWMVFLAVGKPLWWHRHVTTTSSCRHSSLRVIYIKPLHPTGSMGPWMSSTHFNATGNDYELHWIALDWSVSRVNVSPRKSNALEGLWGGTANGSMNCTRVGAQHLGRELSTFHNNWKDIYMQPLHPVDRVAPMNMLPKFIAI